MTLGDAVKLKGYTLRKTADGQTEFVLYWECSASISEEHAVFVHLFPTDRSLLPAQRRAAGYLNLDNRPQVSTTKWKPGEMYRSVHRGAAPAGRYRCAVGLYSVAAGVRMQPGEAVEKAPERMALPLGEIVVE